MSDPDSPARFFKILAKIVAWGFVAIVVLFLVVWGTCRL
jgi:hypothetical protein